MFSGENNNNIVCVINHGGKNTGKLKNIVVEYSILYINCGRVVWHSREETPITERNEILWWSLVVLRSDLITWKK